MRRPRHRGPADGDPHGRFGEWLTAAPDEEPPRDLAVHASVCRECQRQIAALDLLTTIDPARAGLPPLRPVATRSRWRTASRVAAAMAGILAVVAIGVGSWRLLEAGGLGSRPTEESPTQAVLGNTGQPEGSLGASPSPSAAPSASSSTAGSAAASAAASATAAAPASLPLATPAPLPISQPPAATARPTVRPSVDLTASPRPSPSRSPTPSPTPQPTPEATPSPTPEPTILPSLPPAPAS
jgi:hypothetical protein